MPMKISIRWALIAGFLGLIWGTELTTTTSSYLTSQQVLRQHARDIMQNIAGLAMEQSQNHLLHAHSAAALTRRLLAANVVSSDTEKMVFSSATCMINSRSTLILPAFMSERPTVIFMMCATSSGMTRVGFGQRSS
ncbi:hypothetical protein [Desulfosarcina cetonica]|uniref:hypothetical protein n=1 Tax=Desulfosarcina cetonica TaxID=90730 RepID=UPI0006CF20C0|nr:hypothetical protein [Desulfosarcina cetonica]